MSIRDCHHLVFVDHRPHRYGAVRWCHVFVSAAVMAAIGTAWRKEIHSILRDCIRKSKIGLEVFSTALGELPQACFDIVVDEETTVEIRVVLLGKDTVYIGLAGESESEVTQSPTPSKRNERRRTHEGHNC